MSNLREEFQNHKSQKASIVEDAAFRWVQDNVVVINEKINRTSINRLISSIDKFEETFGPYKGRVPSIASILDGAEENLQQVLTGKAGDKRTSEMLEYLSYVYNVFSTFFSKDLPVILKTKIFKAASESPGTRLDSLTVSEDGGVNFSADVAQKALAHAVCPSPEEMKLIGKILKTKSMPKIDSKKIASELMSLSYEDLKDLTNMHKVPLVTTPKDPSPVVEEQKKKLTEAVDQKKLDTLNSRITGLVNALKPLSSAMPQTSQKSIFSK
jgi:hypothetical protein